MANYVVKTVIAIGPEDAIETFFARCFRISDPDRDEPDLDFEAIGVSETPEESTKDEAAEHIERRRQEVAAVVVLGAGSGPSLSRSVRRPRM